ncbi:MAG: hypothetical protein JWM27_3 [Gemmatimonadetes bacterium]|nr:hypothetical protein [Gemmatimonadota bacterium]
MPLVILAVFLLGGCATMGTNTKQTPTNSAGSNPS